MEKAIYRIIDANFNRAREGARVIEEYARFALNSSDLSAKAKQLRHKLCSEIAKLDQATLLVSRDSSNDVGFQLKIDGQLKRTELRDAFIAASKRLPEALRALSELTQTIDPQMAADIEALRFQAYNLEKEIFLAADSYEKYKNVQLYVLIDSDSVDGLGDLTKLCIQGGADCIQLRSKGSSDSELCKLADKLVKLCADSDVVSIINDRLDIALSVGADGVHFGQDDMPLSLARKIATKPMIFGLSTHNPQQLREAIDLRADYVGLGPTFPSRTKDFADFAGLEYLEQAISMLKDTSIGHAAIGGITSENLEKVLAVGVKTVAVSSEVTMSQDPEKACRKLRDVIESYS